MLPPPKDIMFYLCLFVCVFVCPPDYSKTRERISMKFFGEVGRGPQNNRLDFGGEPDHDPDTGIFKVFLQDVSIACYASLVLATIGMSVCLSVCPSVTRWH